MDIPRLIQILFSLRIGLIILLYAFLALAILIIWYDARVTARRAPTTTRSQPTPTGQLIVVDAGQSNLVAGQTFPLLPVTALGRSPSNTIIIPDPFASHEHALLAYHDGHWWLEDLNSTNGTLLNDEPIDQPVIVTTGDIIGIGHVRLRVELKKS